jgi:hypothetical protein
MRSGNGEGAGELFRMENRTSEWGLLTNRAFVSELALLNKGLQSSLTPGTRVFGVNVMRRPLAVFHTFALRTNEHVRRTGVVVGR